MKEIINVKCRSKSITSVASLSADMWVLIAFFSFYLSWTLRSPSRNCSPPLLIVFSLIPIREFLGRYLLLWQFFAEVIQRANDNTARAQSPRCWPGLHCSPCLGPHPYHFPSCSDITYSLRPNSRSPLLWFQPLGCGPVLMYCLLLLPEQFMNGHVVSFVFLSRLAVCRVILYYSLEEKSLLWWLDFSQLAMT